MFKVSSSGYYSWLKRREEPNENEEERKRELRYIMECFRFIISVLGFVPGKRTFRTHMWRRFGMTVSVKRCARIMKMMNLMAKLPKKDAYKGQATHYHPCNTMENKVNQNFYIGPRKVILTDITYIYFGLARIPCYLCAFKDAYTREILGYSVGMTMTVELVKKAYDMMMKYHRDEIHTEITYIHSDQGSQYLSTTFKKLLADDKFIQSVSARGNSQDNAPMESFFGRMKCHIIDLIALCPDFKTVEKLIDGYIDTYNNEAYQYELGGLTPAEFYTYKTTDNYPLDNYYGVEASELNTPQQLAEACIQRRIKEAEDRRNDSQEKRDERALLKSPSMIVYKDLMILNREIKKWDKARERCEKQLVKLNDLYGKAEAARRYISSCDKKTYESLRDPLEWANHEELHYVKEIMDLY